MIEFIEEIHTTDPRQPRLLVRDRDLLRQLMLPFVQMRRSRLSSVMSPSCDEFVVQFAKRRQADQSGGGRECRRQARARAGVHDASRSERRCPDVVEIGRVVELKSRLRGNHLVERQRRAVLVVDVARQQQIRPAIEETTATGRVPR